MHPRPDPFIDAKEIAGIVKMSPRHIRRPNTQRKLGIASARDRGCDRPIRFHRARAIAALREMDYEMEAQES